MKINRLETHDRLIHFKQDQQSTIFDGIDQCLKRNPDSISLQEKSSYVYVFAHARTADNGTDTKILWQPRLSKPEPQPNSILVRVISNTDNIEICWILPKEEFWSQYKPGNIVESDIVSKSIDMYNKNKHILLLDHPEDLSSEQIKNIWLEIAREKEQKLMNHKILYV